MKQVFITGKGAIEILDVPLPSQIPNSILVRNVCSVISSGTEGAAVASRPGWLGVIEKAAKSRDKVEAVWKLAKTKGLKDTWAMVQGKLEEHRMIGYTSAGVVVETNGDTDFATGDRVACMGVGFANHAEYIVVPNNLAVKIPDGVASEHAALGALACIAQQGVRVLGATPGETVVVLGLGLIGALAARQAYAMGYKVIGADLSSARAKHLQDQTGIPCWGLDDADLPRLVAAATNGRGADAVIVCAATKSDAPVNLAFDLCRAKGSVSIVGDVGLSLDRAKMYRKELSLFMSCSYGPGRYNPLYEIEGMDYPAGHVRWTERRNLEHYLDLLSDGRLDAAPMISGKFPIANAVDAYRLVKEGDSATYGVVLEYGSEEDGTAAALPARTIRTAVTKPLEGVIGLGLIGCGGFTQAVHLPNLAKLKDRFAVQGISSRTGATAAILARKHKIPICGSDHDELLRDEAIDAVMILTRHASHARLCIEALKAGKHVFVEKPMCLTVAEGREIEALATEKGLVVRVGFNRRFAPAIEKMQAAIGAGGQRVFTCRVDVGKSAKDHWSNDPAEGGRFLGEGVHFLDLCNWFIGEEPEAVIAQSLGPADITNPNLAVTIRYASGSLGQVLYSCEGDTGLGKEDYQAMGNGVTVTSRDMTEIQSGSAQLGLSGKEKGDKGQFQELAEFAAVISGAPGKGADARAGHIATWMALAAVESAREGRAVYLRNETDS